jgi:DNA-binding Lrp family transcriptional regulator
MTKIDRELLFLCSEDARIKIKELSNILKKSPQRLKYNLNLLEKEKLVSKPYCVIDYSFFGLLLFRVYFKGGYISERDKSTILKMLEENPYVVSIYELSGEYDLVLEIEAPNASRFNKELKRIISAIPTFNNYKITLNIVTHIYPRTYMIKNAPLINSGEAISMTERNIIVGGDRQIENFSKEEMMLLQSLVLSPKSKMKRLSSQAGMNVKTAKSLLRKLQKRRIVKGFKQTVDTYSLGIYKQRLFLKLHNLSVEREKNLQEYFMKTSEITQVSKTVGDWDFEVDLETTDKSRARFLVLQLREMFMDLIETFNSMEFYQYHLKMFLPRYLFENEQNKGEEVFEGGKG